MYSFGSSVWGTVLAFALCLPAGSFAKTAQASPGTIRRVSILGGGNNVEVEVIATEPVTPRAQLLTSPDRLVLDFANAVPDHVLRNLSTERGDLKGIRVGLFSASPPVTRVVLDLKRPQAYRLFPSGKTVVIKLGTEAAKPIAAAQQPRPLPVIPVRATPPAPAAPRVLVQFHDQMLRLQANKATLAEVLTEVHRQTGAEIPVPPGAQQEQVVVDLGPGPVRDVLVALLNGSNYNFVIVESEAEPGRLQSLFLTPRGNSPVAARFTPPPPSQPAPAAAPVAEADPAAPEPDTPADATDVPPQPPATGDAGPQ